jgi:hypothetical protein
LKCIACCNKLLCAIEYITTSEFFEENKLHGDPEIGPARIVVIVYPLVLSDPQP